MKLVLEKIPLWLLRLVAILATVALIYLAWHSFQGEEDISFQSREAGRSRVGQAIEDFSVPANLLASKTKFQLSQLKGHPIILHFWATWCAPCVHELPELLKLAREVRKDGFSIVAIAVDDDWKTVDRFFAKYPNLAAMRDQMILILDPQGTVTNIYGVSRFPETLLINDSFVLDNKLVGPQPWTSSRMRQYLERLKKKEGA